MPSLQRTIPYIRPPSFTFGYKFLLPVGHISLVDTTPCSFPVLRYRPSFRRTRFPGRETCRTTDLVRRVLTPATAGNEPSHTSTCFGTFLIARHTPHVVRESEVAV